MKKEVTMDWLTYQQELENSKQRGRSSMRIEMWEIIKYHQTSPARARQLCEETFEDDSEMLNQIIKWLEL